MKIGQTILLASLFLGLNGALTYAIVSHGVSHPDPTYLRAVGSKLQGAGLDAEAASYYRRYLDEAGNLSVDERANIALTAGSLWMNAGAHKKALAHFYEVESIAPGSPAAKEASKKIVSALERSGKGAAARTAMASRTRLKSADKNIDEANNPIVAKTAFLTVRRSEAELLRAIMPGADSLDDTAFLHQTLARAALLEKAKAAGVADEVDVKQQIQLTTEEILIAALANIRGGATPPPSDAMLLAVYNKNRTRFGDETFEDVRPQVEAIYAMNIQNTLYQQLLRESFRGQKPEVFPGRLHAGKKTGEATP